MDALNGPTLRDYTETRFNLLTEQLRSMGARFDEKIKEADIRYEQRFNAQMGAIAKADEASEKRFESVNEFRKTLTDQSSTFIPRTEFSQGIAALNERLNKAETMITSREARISGAMENKSNYRLDYGMLISGIMMFISIVALIISFLHR